MRPLQVRTVASTGPRILVVDDDAMLRRALVRGLKRKYDVSEFEDAEVALAAVASGEHYDAIFCDLTLHGMTGRQFVFALNAILPAQAERVIILSGTAKASIDDALLAIIGDRYVEKPATLGEIDLVLNDVLGAHARAA